MRVTALLIAAALVAGCASGETVSRSPTMATPSATEDLSAFDRLRAAPGDHDIAVTWQANRRRFLLHVPPTVSPDRPVSLIVALHSLQGSPEEMAAFSGLSRLADRRGFLVLYPAAYGADFNSASCCGYIDDVGLIGAGIEGLGRRWTIDTDRIYAAGMSAGGVMANRLAAELPGVFAAVASIASGRGATVRDDPTAMLSPTPISYFSLVGRSDPSYDQFRDDLDARLAARDCAPAQERSFHEGVTVIDSSCADGSAVRFLSVDGLGHAWPYELYPGTGIADLMWEFFETRFLQGQG